MDIRAVEQGLLERAPLSESGIAAAVIRQTPPSKRRDRIWEVRICDGSLFGWVRVMAHGGGLGRVREKHVVYAVERAAQEAPRSERRATLQSSSPLIYTADELLALG